MTTERVIARDPDCQREVSAAARAAKHEAFTAAWHVVVSDTSGAFLRDLDACVHMSLPPSADRPKRTELVLSVGDLPGLSAAVAMLRAKGGR
jgi:hypothetical protein